jgi:hypothetical protein
MSVNLLANATKTIEKWPELIPLDEPNLPSLNLANFPLWAGKYIRALSVSTETPIELAAVTVLITCATAAARRLNVMIKEGYSEPCNLWAVVALPPGNRKSAVQKLATKPLVAWESEQCRALDKEIKRITSERKTAEARIKDIRNRAAKILDENTANEWAEKAAALEATLTEIPILPQLWTSDSTPERMGVLLAEQNECMAWLSSEGGIFDMLQGRYSNNIPNLDLMLKSHSGDPERVDRTSRPTVLLQSPRLSIGLSPQPDVLSGLAAKPGLRGRGLLARFLYLLPASPLGFRTLDCPPIPNDVLTEYDAGIRAMLTWKPIVNASGFEETHTLSLSADAYSKWFDFAKKIEHEMRPDAGLEHCTDWAGKAPGATARIAGVLHGIIHAKGQPWKIPISRKTMQDAIDIMEVITKHSIAALHFMGTDPKINAARKTLSWIRRNKLPRFTINAAFNKLRGTFSYAADLKQALEILQEHGYVIIEEVVPTGSPGRRPSPTVRVNPAIYEC